MNKIRENKLEKEIDNQLRESKRDLRLFAESKIREMELNDNAISKNYSVKEIDQKLHNLKVHQIELKIQNEELLKVQTELINSKERYYDLFNFAPVGYFTVQKNGVISEMNLAITDLLHMTKTEIHNTKLSRYIHTEDQNSYYFHFKNLYETGEKQESELRFVNADGTVFWVKLQSTLIDNNNCRMIINDIDKIKKAQQKLKESEEKYRLICTSMDQGLSLNEIILDSMGRAVDYKILEVNKSFTTMFGMNRKMCLNKRASEIFDSVLQEHLDIFAEVALTREIQKFEYIDVMTSRHYSVSSYSPREKQFVILTTDITERVKENNAINFMSYHDALTNLYNRRFYQEELYRLDRLRNYPLTLAVGDVNGLKLVNDSFGHEVGDQLLRLFSTVLKDECRGDDIVARIGGDEFVIIFPNTTSIKADEVIKRIRIKLLDIKINSLDISVSFGSATKQDETQDIENIFKQAEDNMYQNKLYETTSVKSNMINIIMSTLFKKNKREKIHSKRVSNLCESIAVALEMSAEQINLARIAGLMHDVGKIGVPDNVLNHKGGLNEDDCILLKRHSEFGYRILSSSVQFTEISSFVLEHHERWDGSGYPNGLEGSEISLIARIIAIADSYDAMRGQRTYGKQLTRAEAVNEIVTNKNKQFDPEIVDVFINKVELNITDDYLNWST